MDDTGGAAGQAGNEALREELRVVDEELAGLREEVARLRDRLGGRSDGPVDLAENAATVTSVEEQEALIQAIEGRRAGLLRKLEA